jgi:hypothetical protein
MVGCSGGGTDTPTNNAKTGSGGSSASTTTGGESGSSSSGTSSSTTTGGGTDMTGGAGSGQGGSDNADCMSSGMDTVPMMSDLVSDFEADAGLAVQTVMPGGVWALDTDKTGTADMKVESCGTTGNGLHFTGATHTVWGADVGAAFIAANAPVDASMYTGISFTLKGTTAVPVIVKLQNPDSEPPFCKCGGTVDAPSPNCYAGYVKTVTASTTATTTTLTWNQITKAGWGYHAPGQSTIDPKNLIGLAFAVDKGIDFDLCIDDVKFTK